MNSNVKRTGWRAKLPPSVVGQLAVSNVVVKQLLVDTALGRAVCGVRWMLQTPQRLRHPELWDLYLEDRRISLALPELIDPSDNCVDVGAHVGSKLAEIRRLAPEGSHVAFEPVSSKAKRLRSSFSDVLIIEAATTDEVGDGQFYVDLERPGFSGLTRPLGDSAVVIEQVRLTRLDDELETWDRVDFLKIDVEGAELPTLRGGKEILEKHRPKMLFECGTNPQLERFGYTRADLFDFLAERGYDVYSIADFVYGLPPMTAQSFETAGLYPYRGFNYVALPAGTQIKRLL